MFTTRFTETSQYQYVLIVCENSRNETSDTNRFIQPPTQDGSPLRVYDDQYIK